jgi:hypothetical protein
MRFLNQKSTATLAGWGVDDVEAVVDELTSRDVAFERYDEGPIVTDERGIAAFEGGAKVAYFRDPDGNTSRSPKRRVPERVQTPSRDCGTAYSPTFREGVPSSRKPGFRYEIFSKIRRL